MSDGPHAHNKRNNKYFGIDYYLTDIRIALISILWWFILPMKQLNLKYECHFGIVWLVLSAYFSAISLKI